MGGAEGVTKESDQFYVGLFATKFRFCYLELSIRSERVARSGTPVSLSLL